MTTDIDVNLEPLPGYRLLEHIGSGGFGEVWRAEAPGGLTKAIKFVFGQLHERRASNELRALDRVRGVRHPFLLSLERIETVDGRLVVVTELADGSLKDRFEACRKEGLSGIPRDELLGYLRDAADALDFMSEAHTLQHLDIKPENLLLLAGHVKVADFGLVKDVRQSEASIVGGMTPLYAAPEVFRGGPSSHSDQYSLAIVYVEMLTGQLPFSAGNAAELTLQHLNDLPDLCALSSADRYVVSRALAKDPQHRYATCREFIDSLVKNTMGESAQGVAAGNGSQSGATAAPDSAPYGQLATDLLDDGQSPWNKAPAELLLPLPPLDVDLVDLPHIALRARDARRVPTVVLGIGGAAGKILSHFSRMTKEQSGGTMPRGVQFLLLDTDQKALAEAAHRQASGFTPNEILHLPLRLPQHYRERSQLLLQWLSRRWLYNIPRSLKTEGLRPLGRLAFVDHAREVVRGLRHAITQAVHASGASTGAASGENEFRSDAVRVFVVASISGGTGGGMALDVGFAARAVLKQLGLAEAELIGVMLHATGRDSRHSELSRVNAFAWLTEYQHFQRPENAYAGDPNCGLPSHDEGVPAFDHTYFVHLGDHLDAVEFDQAAQGVAEYLRLNTLSPAAAFFAACRQESASGSANSYCGEGRTLRSFGVYRRTAAADQMCDELASLVSRHVLAAWRPSQAKLEISSPLERASKALSNGRDGSTLQPPNEQPPAEKSTTVSGAAQLVRRLQIDATGIAANARSMLELQLGGDAATFLANWAAKQSRMRDTSEREQLEAIDRIFHADGYGPSQSRKAFLLGQSASAIVQPLEEKLRSEIRRWSLSRVDDPRERLPGARTALSWINEHFHETEANLKRLRQVVVGKFMEVREVVDAAIKQPEAGGGQPAQPISPAVLAYFQLRLDESAIAAAEHIVRVIVADAKAMADELTAFGREIDQLEAAMARAASAAQASSRTLTDSHVGEGSLGPANLAALLPKLAAEVDFRLQAEYVRENGGLMKTVMQGGRPRALLCAKLQEFSRRAVQQALADINVLEHSAQATAGQSRAELRSGLAAATSPLLEFGGTRRVLAILPRDSCGPAEADELSRTLGVEVTGVRGGDNGLTLCVEAGQLSVQHIALDLVQRRRDRAEFARRVHCRNDISWSSLLSGTSTTSVSVWNGSDRRSTQTSEELCKTLVI
ncbi:MAG TPA: tubulin-like doman-containing protein [Lacipirellulaceae bacterium]